MDRFKIKFEFGMDEYLATVNPKSKEDQSFEFHVIFAKTTPPTSGGEMLIKSIIDGEGDPMWIEVGPI